MKATFVPHLDRMNLEYRLKVFGGRSKTGPIREIEQRFLSWARLIATATLP